MDIYWLTFYLALPAFFANMLPVISARLKLLERLAIPVDGGKKIGEKRILGANKTIRGFIVGIVGAMILASIQFYFGVTEIIFYPFETIVGAAWFGFLAGSGALFGDAVKSFFKRQANIKSGRPFIPFDQIDYMVGFLFLTSLVYSWQVNQILFLLIFVLIANPLVNAISYVLGIKSTYW